VLLLVLWLPALGLFVWTLTLLPVGGLGNATALGLLPFAACALLVVGMGCLVQAVRRPRALTRDLSFVRDAAESGRCYFLSAAGARDDGPTLAQAQAYATRVKRLLALGAAAFALVFLPLVLFVLVLGSLS
jgi:hypothetical protein